jgi:hypothetical protein
MEHNSEERNIVIAAIMKKHELAWSIIHESEILL